ncbi:MAG: tetratricopeptide repeat protein [Hormoscilla sp. GUM202]|nr:tetratricopeptide repeat protein [Hormoscilla sp. GUM202]
MYLEALQMRKRILGNEHPLVATSLHSLGELLQPRMLQQSRTLLSRSIADEGTPVGRPSSRFGYQSLRSHE